MAGIDEAGRGPLAGPVVAAAVVLDPAGIIEGLDDSKKLAPTRRERLARQIADQALALAIGICHVDEIERLNILGATLLAMRKAFSGLTAQVSTVLVDGNCNPGIEGVETRLIVGGDGLEPVISAASIIAKVHRDGLMQELDQCYPGYGFRRHKGYGTREHLAALRELGPCPAHRRSFRPVVQSELLRSSRICQ